MPDQVGSLLCLMTIPFGVVNSIYHVIATRPRPQRWRYHVGNAVLAVFFYGLATAGSGSDWGDSWPLVLARLWLPIVYYWWAYAWAGTTLHNFYPPEFSFDAQVLAAEQKLFGNPARWMAKASRRGLNEFMNFFYWSYYFYTPVLGLALFAAGEYRRFEAMAMAVNLGYAICYSIYPWYPLWGPRWTLFSAGMLPKSEQVLRGYAVTAFMNRIMWTDTAHKGGAMPSAHSSTCIIFMIWCWRIWDVNGLIVGATIAVLMFISTVYGRYHYVIDLIVGTAIGLLAVWLADSMLLLG